MKNKLKKLLILGLTFTFLLTGCQSKDADQETGSKNSGVNQEESKELVTVRFANLKVGLASAYHELGVEQGIFEKYGIELEVVNFIKGGAEAIAGAASGDVDMGSFGTPILTGISKGIEIKIVASPPVKGNPFVLVAKTGIESVEDLKGKTIATGSFGGGNHQSLVKVLERNGLSESDVYVVATGGTDEYLVLSSGNVDAVMTSEPTISRLVADGVGTVLVNASDVYGTYQHSFVFASDKFIKDHPESVTNFLKASRESHEYAKDHFDELVAKGIELTDLDEAIVREFYTKDIEKWDLTFAINLEGTENAVNILKNLGELEESVEFDQATWIDSSLLE